MAKLHGESIHSCLHSDTALWLAGVVADLILGRVLKKLVLAHPMTGVQYDLVPCNLVLIWRIVVKAVTIKSFVLQHPKEARPVLRHVQLWIHVVQEPPEVLALQLLTKLPPLCHVPKGFQASVGITVVVEVFEAVHPHFSRTDAVGQSLFAGVRSLLGENMAHVRTGMRLQAPTALPDLHTERKSPGQVSG